MTFLEVWIGYAIFGTSLFSAVFVWAVRQRQFTDIESARSIALDAEESIEHDYGRPTKADWTSLAGMLIVAIAVIAAGVLVAWSCTRRMH